MCSTQKRVWQAWQRQGEASPPWRPQGPTPPYSATLATTIHELCGTIILVRQAPEFGWKHAPLLYWPPGGLWKRVVGHRDLELSQQPSQYPKKADTMGRRGDTAHLSLILITKKGLSLKTLLYPSLAGIRSR